jgi:histidinol-phosphate/aromatic aminotransferase/cobyric acid decarboxylase-like protein
LHDYRATLSSANPLQCESCRAKNLDVECGYGLRLAASQANFLFMDTSRPSREVAEAMMRRGVIVKPWLEPGFDAFIRVTVGPSADNECFIGAFREAMAEIRPV